MSDKQKVLVEQLRPNADKIAGLRQEFAAAEAVAAEKWAIVQRYDGDAGVAEALAASDELDRIGYRIDEEIRVIVDEVEAAYHNVPFAKPRQAGVDAVLKALGIR